MDAVKYYDKIYSFKDYEQEASKIARIIGERLQSEGRHLLDVACGTGKHIEYLKEEFDVEGLDISREMLDIARVRNPNVTFHQADMIDFDLGKKYDVITCLFSAIGYAKTHELAGNAIASMSRHLVAGGLLIIEPWFPPDVWHAGTVHAMLIDEPDLKIARVNTSFVKGRISYFDLHHLIGTPEGTTYRVEHHELGLFTIEEMKLMFTDADLSVTYDTEGITGRGLYVGEKTS
ncbi:MAG TPA: class I SAM-dependent methyltransferase [Candidatus Acetothermia bacterium]|nr:class I SAM-dependent methyltransferase [Candidatus Acetothermia bacterium]